MMSNNVDSAAQNNREELTKDECEKDEEEEEPEQIHGLLVSYRDDGLNESIQSALQNKKRVHYKCMDAISNYVALGTSVGAIYLFRLANVTHATCSLALVIPCDQGPIEVIKFVPGGQPQGLSDGLLVVIGTSRGSLVIFQLTSNEQSVTAREIYRAEEFTRSEYESSIGIKLIEHDQDLFDPTAPFQRLYICDQRNRIFVLEQANIYPAFRLPLYSQKPAPILSVNESTIHQICAHRSQLLLSTDEKTRLFSEYSNELLTIGKKQRKSRGFFGACFYNTNFKPARMQPPSQQRQHLAGGFGGSSTKLSYSQQSIYSSTASLAELESLLIFVARPKFSLWQVNSKREVMFTHMFETSIREATRRPRKVVQLHNDPLREEAGESCVPSIGGDRHLDISEALQQELKQVSGAPNSGGPKSDHFERLISIFSSTLGNLLLSHTRHEIHVIDPISAQLIVSHSFDKPILQVACSENEIFVMLEVGRRQARVERLVLLAPTQFVLELHRLNRFLSLVAFVQLFKEQFMRLMALPLSGPGVISTEGGLLRNIVWSTWREINDKLSEQDRTPGTQANGVLALEFSKFKGIVDVIAEESAQFKQSVDNLTDSRLLFTASHENIERLCSEPYASMVSLDISIANLHTNHVVHFSQEALNRHKSLAKLSQSIMNLSQLNRGSGATSRASLLDLTSGKKSSREILANFEDKRVHVEPLRPRINLKADGLSGGLSLKKIDEVANNEDQLTPLVEEAPKVVAAEQDGANSQAVAAGTQVEHKAPADETRDPDNEDEDPTRCPECKWPRARAHLEPMRLSQQIQYGWLQENLLPNFEENIEQIQERAFRHGLWHVVLKCLAFKNQLEEYVRCCLMLDDIRLLNAKRFIITRCSEDHLIDLVFKQLELKLDFLEKHRDDNSNIICLRCGHETHRTLRHGDDSSDDESLPDERDGEQEDDEEDNEISFNLVGLFKKLLRKSADIKRAINMLLQHPNLLEKSEIPATFYLEALSLYPRPHRVGTT